MAVIKQIDIGEMTEEERKETLREAKILEVLNHPNITRFREVYKTKKGKLCIVMDYCDGGDLQTKVKNQAKIKDASGKVVYFSENEVLNWFTQICLALKHVHDKKILHRDLKSQNLFLTKRGILKLGDFGIARVLSNTKSKAKTVVGTPYYLSPEIIRSEGYNFKSDIWSLGVLLYEMAALQPPFNAQSLH
jgi:NIMA (never in mitosis gene a)-related kinase